MEARQGKAIAIASVLILVAIGACYHVSGNLNSKVDKARLRKLSRSNNKSSASLSDKGRNTHRYIHGIAKSNPSNQSSESEGESNVRSAAIEVQPKEANKSDKDADESESAKLKPDIADKASNSTHEPFDYEEFRNECIDNTRVTLNWTNTTCVTRGMLLDGVSVWGNGLSNAYLSCGAEAVIYKVEKTKTIVQMEKRMSKLIALAVASGFLPMIASSLVFQALSGTKKSEYEEIGDSQTKSCWESFVELFGRFGFLLFVVAVICVGAYTTYMTTLKVYAEIGEFRNDLHFGGACDLYMFMNYVQHEEIFCVLTLACYSWSDFLFHTFRFFADTCLCLKGSCLTLWMPIEYICCCKWWSCFVYKVKIFFCCLGIQKWIDVFCCCWCGLCRCIMAKLCILLLFVVCYFPLLALTLVVLLYTFGAIGIVLLFYLALALLAIFALLLVVYVLFLPIQVLAKCVGKKDHVEGLGEYFSNSFDRLSREMKSDSTEVPSGFSCKCCLSGIKDIVTSKKFALCLPSLLPLGFFVMQFSADQFMMMWTTYHTSSEDRQKLTDALNGSYQEAFLYLWSDYCALFVQANEFVKEMMIDKIVHAADFVQSLQQYLDPNEFMVAIATLADLGAKFQQFENAVMAMRFSSGLMIGPLKLFEMLAKFDRA